MLWDTQRSGHHPKPWCSLRPRCTCTILEHSQASIPGTWGPWMVPPTHPHIPVGGQCCCNPSRFCHEPLHMEQEAAALLPPLPLHSTSRDSAAQPLIQETTRVRASAALSASLRHSRLSARTHNGEGLPLRASPHISPPFQPCPVTSGLAGSQSTIPALHETESCCGFCTSKEPNEVV